MCMPITYILFTKNNIYNILLVSKLNTPHEGRSIVLSYENMFKKAPLDNHCFGVLAIRFFSINTKIVHK